MDNVPFAFAQKNHPLAPHTRYRIGGPAAWALFPPTTSAMKEAYHWLMETNTPFIVLGGGTNVLIDDQGYPGCVLFTTKLQTMQPLGNHRYTVGAGMMLSDVVRQLLLPNNYHGVGALTGIPGTVGGAVYMNAGTANGSICELTETVSLLRGGRFETVSVTPDAYGYRGQSFCKENEVIVDATLACVRSEHNEADTYHHYMQRRKTTQPEGWCCGSVFKNPPNDHAGRLIEAVGLKGTRHNGACISDKHANFIMNEDTASFDDVLYLITLAKDKVREQFGVELKEEVRIIPHRTLSAGVE